ncbi:terminase large subunit [Streptomyces bohaiensis]|uniref:Terminase large subunit n=1 Tax=Streptomyces bohaiensis TaxID=1431344 RepID=A0ABX1CA28_9ACTN|nr:terminase TerL endonuclease subunit [Streptomyces bohaiensis]NJQ14217.1 terminase large subunit [Streptomyces bohaiensis]
MPRKTTRSPKGKPPAAYLDEALLSRLKLSPEVAWYLTERGIPLPDCPPKVITPSPGEAPGAVFDPGRVDRVLKSFHLLRHTQGKWAGKPLDPDPWQVAYVLAPVFGWVRHDAEAGGYVRVVRRLYVDVPRRNGKTTLAGGIAVYLLAADGEPGAQVYAAATSEKQARFTFDPIRQIAERAPALKGNVKAFTKRITHPASGSYFTVVSSVAEAMHGANVHGGIIDELHVHRGPDLVETIETGTGSRRQPLVVIITTADDGRQESIYDRRRQYIEQLARGALTDPDSYGVVWGADTEDDPFAEETLRKANPGYGVSPSAAYLRGAAAEARQSPADLAKYLRLHLGIRTKQSTRYIRLEDWDANAGIVDEQLLRGREAYGGLDLASTSDLCALSWLFPEDDGEGLAAIWRFWVPEAALRDLDKRTAGAASRWVREGWLTATPGNVVDYDWIREQIRRDLDAFDVRSLGYDPWNASQLTNDLASERAPLVKVRQGFITMSPAMKALQRLVLAGTPEVPRLRHGGNPVARWCVDNLAVAMDPAGNVKPDKARAGEKIDGVSSLATAMSEVLARPPVRKSVYEDGDFEAI